MNTNLTCLLLDVDGPLNPYNASTVPEGYETRYVSLRGINCLRLYLNNSHGEKLLSLGYEIIWATMWEEDANTFIGPNIGLPKLEVIKFPYSYHNYDYKLYMKTPAILKHMNKLERPYVWVDDEVTKYDHDFLALNSTVPCDTLRIDASKGLTDEDFSILLDIRKTLEARMALEGSQSQSDGLTELSST